MSRSVTRRSDFPTTAHFAILEFATVHHEGDERSRTNPGHGYPAHDESVCYYYAFDDRESWMVEIQKRADREFRSYSTNQWVAFEAGKKVDIKVTIGVTI